MGDDIELVWLPWETALSKAPPRHGGGRKDRDEVHSVQSAVLYAPRPKFLGVFGAGLQSFAAHAEVRKGNPVVYLGDSETNRLQIISRERLSDFVALFRRLRGNPNFLFSVKLRFQTDHGEFGGAEHLWFSVDDFDGVEFIEATCLNEPHAVSTLKSGVRARHALERLSAWRIDSALGEFDAETVGALVRRLAELSEAAAAKLGLRPLEG